MTHSTADDKLADRSDNGHSRNESGTDLKRDSSRESRARSLAKALSWRVVATLTTGVIAYFVTGTLEAAALIGGIEFVVKFVIYYMHERAWQMVP